MASLEQEVCITGVGIVSSLGEGVETNWIALNAVDPRPVIDREKFYPYTVHPMVDIDWSRQIPRKGDQRQMGNWQRLGVYSAGLALEDAVIKSNHELCSTMDLVVAAGSGERDIEIDTSIMQESIACNDRGLLLNNRLQNDLRPTLFLAQLSNLLAGNISIVHKVIGSSRTYMGEENAGATAIKNAFDRIQSGQSSHLLVGASYNCERWDLLLPYELGGYLSHAGYRDVWSRKEDKSGIIFGSIGIFLVLESSHHAYQRGCVPYAQLSSVETCFSKRDNNNDIKNRVGHAISQMGLCKNTENFGILSAATGVENITRCEYNILTDQFGENVPIRGFCTMLGHCVEGNFPLGIALAAIALRKNSFYKPFNTDIEVQPISETSSILVTSFGCYHGENMALVKKIA